MSLLAFGTAWRWPQSHPGRTSTRTGKRTKIPATDSQVSHWNLLALHWGPSLQQEESRPLHGRSKRHHRNRMCPPSHAPSLPNSMLFSQTRVCQLHCRLCQPSHGTSLHICPLWQKRVSSGGPSPPAHRVCRTFTSSCIEPQLACGNTAFRRYWRATIFTFNEGSKLPSTLCPSEGHRWWRTQMRHKILSKFRGRLSFTRKGFQTTARQVGTARFAVECVKPWLSKYASYGCPVKKNFFGRVEKNVPRIEDSQLLACGTSIFKKSSSQQENTHTHTPMHSRTHAPTHPHTTPTPRTTHPRRRPRSQHADTQAHQQTPTHTYTHIHTHTRPRPQPHPHFFFSFFKCLKSLNNWSFPKVRPEFWVFRFFFVFRVSCCVER